jgi:hypothetical protein
MRIPTGVLQTGVLQTKDRAENSEISKLANQGAVIKI